MDDTNYVKEPRLCRRLGTHPKYIHIHPDEVDRLNGNGEGTGLKINTKKSKRMKIDAKIINAVVLDGKKTKDVDFFDYLGARLTKHGEGS